MSINRSTKHTKYRMKNDASVKLGFRGIILKFGKWKYFNDLPSAKKCGTTGIHTPRALKRNQKGNCMSYRMKVITAASVPLIEIEKFALQLPKYS